MSFKIGDASLFSPRQSRIFPRNVSENEGRDAASAAASLPCHVKTHKYQAGEILKTFGIPVPEGEVASILNVPFGDGRNPSP